MSATITPYLTVDDAAGAIEFYKKAFGAREPGARILGDDGRVGHASLEIGDATLYLADAYPEMEMVSPRTLGNSPSRLVLNVDDVDSVFASAVDAGAESLIEPADQFYGERSGRLRDPYGHIWILSTTLQKDVSPEEIREGSGGQYRASKPDA